MKALVGGSWEVLVSRSCTIRSSSRSFYDALLDPRRGPGMLVRVFVQSVVRRFCEDPSENAVRGLCMILHPSF